MASLIEAINRLGPKIRLNSTVPQRDLAEYISKQTGLNPTQINMVLGELKDAVLFFNRQGTPVMLPGLGWFSPSITRDGQFRINLRVASDLRKGINQSSSFGGRVDNRGNIGVDNLALKTQWDTENPDNPLVL